MRAILRFLGVLLVSWGVVVSNSAADEGAGMENGQQGKETLRVRLEIKDKGNIDIELFGDKTPLTVANFLNLANRGYYDGIIFHRVINDFMIQGGDPTGTGRGGPGYRFEDEFDPSLKHDSAGILSMANAGPATNGSQFFITHLPTPHLDGRHSVFGKVVKGQDVVNKVVQGDKIERATVYGPYEDLFKKPDIAKRIAAWNEILDREYPAKRKE